MIDDWGRTPLPFAADDGTTIFPPAYQQVLKGLPAVNYSARDIIYRPRNVRARKVYGYSPVQQVLMTVNIGLRREKATADDPKHPGWPADTPGGIGGRFRPTNELGSGDAEGVVQTEPQRPRQYAALEIEARTSERTSAAAEGTSTHTLLQLLIRPALWLQEMNVSIRQPRN